MRARSTRNEGFSLVELMIAMVIGLAVVAAVATLSLNATRSYRATNQANQQLENGRYALSLLKDDIEHAGFYGFSPLILKLPSADPADPCDLLPATHLASLVIPVRGYSASSGICNATDAQPNTDIMVIRRADTNVTPSGSLSAGYTYLQTTPDRIVIAISDGTTQGFHLRKPDNETQLADIRQYHVHLYYIRSWSGAPGDGVPTLVKRYLTKNGSSAAMTTEPLIEGIEDMRIQYGLDAPSGTDCLYSALTADCDGTPNAYLTASSMSSWKDWANVVTVKINLLARSLEPERSDIAAKQFDLGTGSLITPDASVSNYTRHVFSQVVRINHPSNWRDREK